MEMEPEELAPYVLKYLSDRSQINRYNFTLVTSPDIIKYCGGVQNQLLGDRLMEAWMWLEKELLITPKAGQQSDWAVITRKSREVLQNENFEAIKHEKLLPSDHLDPALLRKVKPLFIRGDYDTAIFQAYKEVEIRVRKKSGLGNELIGVELMRKAFGSGGPLFNPSVHAGESNVIRELFCGAIGH